MLRLLFAQYFRLTTLTKAITQTKKLQPTSSTKLPSNPTLRMNNNSVSTAAAKGATPNTTINVNIITWIYSILVY